MSFVGYHPVIIRGDSTEVLDPVLDHSTSMQYSTSACVAVQNIGKSMSKWSFGTHITHPLGITPAILHFNLITASLEQMLSRYLIL